jgi:hypothetical protein
MSTSREVARDKLVVLLTAALVGTGLPVKTVTGSKVEELAGLSPLVGVMSAGSGRPPLTFQGNQAIFEFSVQSYVLQSGTGWTTAQAIDALDTIESIIAETYARNQRGDVWEILEYSGDTTVVELSVKGVPYYAEVIPTRVKLAKE